MPVLSSGAARLLSRTSAVPYAAPLPHLLPHATALFPHTVVERKGRLVAVEREGRRERGGKRREAKGPRVTAREPMLAFHRHHRRMHCCCRCCALAFRHYRHHTQLLEQPRAATRGSEPPPEPPPREGGGEGAIWWIWWIWREEGGGRREEEE